MTEEEEEEEEEEDSTSFFSSLHMAFIFVPPVVFAFSALGIATYYASKEEEFPATDANALKCQNRSREALFACKSSSKKKKSGENACQEEFQSALKRCTQ